MITIRSLADILSLDPLAIGGSPQADFSVHRPFSSRRAATHSRLATIAVWAVIACLQGSPVTAKDWAIKMFKTTSHDFGTVARGAEAHFDFEFENPYEEEVHISDVRSSCGCTTATVTKADLKTWEKSTIHAAFNTRSFIGKKNATITIAIDRPYAAEVQLTVTGFIRSDVVFDPGEIEFGEVEAGSDITKSVLIKYAGRNDWRITKIKTPGAYFAIKAAESERSSGRVVYKMDVSLKQTAPPGFFTEQISIVTNDEANITIPFNATGSVLSALKVNPASLQFGALSPGQKVTKQIVVRGNKPFRVTDVRCDDDCFSFEPNDQALQMHLVPVTFTAGNDPGKFSQTITIQTDLLGSGTCLVSAAVRGAAESR